MSLFRQCLLVIDQ